MAEDGIKNIFTNLTVGRGVMNIYCFINPGKSYEKFNFINSGTQSNKQQKSQAESHSNGTIATLQHFT